MNGATASSPTIAAVASAKPFAARRDGKAAVETGVAMTLPLAAEKAGGSKDQHDHHDHEDYRVRRLRIKHLREPLDDTQTEAGDDRAQDRPHAADHDDGENDNDKV